MSNGVRRLATAKSGRMPAPGYGGFNPRPVPTTGGDSSRRSRVKQSKQKK